MKMKEKGGTHHIENDENKAFLPPHTTARRGRGEASPRTCVLARPHRGRQRRKGFI